MPRLRSLVALCFAFSLCAEPARSQDAPLFTEDFPPAEFQVRREAVYDAIGSTAVALQTMFAVSPGGTAPKLKVLRLAVPAPPRPTVPASFG
jgi:hypothetical protein